MRRWPPIQDEELLERLGLSDDEFFDAARAIFAGIGPREYDASVFENALRYPFERPDGSYVLRDGSVQTFEAMTDAEKASTLESFSRARHPIVSFGANGSPSRLEAKFAHFPDEADRETMC